MSKKNRERYEKLNNRYGTKYGITGREVARIRSSAISGHLTQADIISVYKNKIEKALAHIEKVDQDRKRLQETLNFLETCTEVQFADITNANPPKEMEEHGTA